MGSGGSDEESAGEEARERETGLTVDMALL